MLKPHLSTYMENAGNIVYKVIQVRRHEKDLLTSNKIVNYNQYFEKDVNLTRDYYSMRCAKEAKDGKDKKHCHTCHF